MDHAAGREEETTHSFSAADLSEVVDSGFTVRGGETGATDLHTRRWTAGLLRQEGELLQLSLHLSVRFFCSCVLFYFMTICNDIEIKVC